jgi:lysophospholipase L1-like esterase
MMHKLGFLVVILTCGSVLRLVASPTQVSAPTLKNVAHFIPASDVAFHFEGRVDRRNPAEPVLIWQGTLVDVIFEGDSLGLCFGARKGVAYFDLTVDGETSVIELKEGEDSTTVRYSKPLCVGQHRFTLFKRSEADAGHAGFRGIELAPGGRVQPNQAQPPKPMYQFFGDSITVGACNEDGAVDQWENRATHNNALSYAALTARAFRFGYRNTAVSGMGIVIGYVPKRAEEVCDRLYPEIDAPKAEEQGQAPDVVFLNFGENDDSFSKNQAMDFPAGFADGYVSLVKKIRASYPKAEIVLLRGGMFGGAKSEPLRVAWEKAVQRLAAEDAHLHTFVFQHWSETHPRASDHRAMSEELVSWLKTQPFMQRFLCLIPKASS